MSARRIVVKTAAVVAVLGLIATAAIAGTGGFGGGAQPGEPLARESMLTPDDLGDGILRRAAVRRPFRGARAHRSARGVE